MAVVVLGRQCGGGTSHKLLVDSEGCVYVI